MDYIIIILLILLIVLLIKNNQKPSNDSLDQKFEDIVEELNSSFKNLSNELQCLKKQTVQEPMCEAK